MARASGLPALGLTPFGSSANSFNAFNVASSSEKAYLEFRKIEIQWENGQIDNAAYIAAMTTYAGKLKAGSSERLNAEARVKDTQFRVDRNTLVADIDTGKKTYADLLAFDEKAMEGLNPASQEYQQRQANLFNSQTNEFRTRERTVSEEVQAGRMKYAAALSWYEAQRAALSDSQNADLLRDIDDSIKAVKKQVVAEQDQQMIDDWQDGKIKIDQLLSYAAKVQAAEPDTERAKTWKENATQAQKQAVAASLEYRYNLTEEYRDLAVFLAEGPPQLGGGGMSKGRLTTRQVMDENGQWQNVTTRTGQKPLAGPSAAAVQAYKEWQLKAAAAKKRQAEITKMVSGLPGGWVNEDDMIRVIASQQADLQKGTPEWLALQSKIDGFNDRKATDALMAKSGIRVSVPTVKSERQASADVSPLERPITGTGKTSAPKVAAGSGGGGGGGGSASVGSGGAKGATPAAGGTTANKFLKQIVGTPLPTTDPTKLVAIPSPTGGARTQVVWQATGLPKGMNPKEFDLFYRGMTAAVRDGATTWTDPTTKVTYLLPPDPSDRLEIMHGLDDANINLKATQVNAKTTTSGFQTAMKAYNTAVANANTNTIYVLDSPIPGATKLMPQEVADLFVAADEQAAPIAATIKYMDRVEQQVGFLTQQAQEAMDRGDVQAAYGFLRSASDVMGGPASQKVSAYAALATQRVAGLQAAGAKVPEGGDVGTDLSRIAEVGAGTWLAKLAKDSGLDEVSAFFTDKNTPIKVNPQTGQPEINPQTGEFMLKEGFVRQVTNGGKKIEIVQARMEVDPRTGRLVANDPNKELVWLQVGETFVPVLSDFTVGYVGTANGQGIKGKIVDLTYNGQRYIVAQNPLSPDQWLPINQGGIQFTMPAGAQVIKGSSKLGQTGEQIAFTLPMEGVPLSSTTGAGITRTGVGHFVLALDASTGQYDLWAADAQGNLTTQVANNDIAGILKAAGFGLNTNALTKDQKIVVSSGLNGAYLGASDRVTQQAQQWYASTHPNGPAMTKSSFVNSMLAQAMSKLVVSHAPAPNPPSLPGRGTGKIYEGQNDPLTGTKVPPTINPYTGPGATKSPFLNTLLASVQKPKGDQTPTINPATGFPMPAATPQLPKSTFVQSLLKSATTTKKSNQPKTVTRTTSTAKRPTPRVTKPPVAVTQPKPVSKIAPKAM